MDEDEQSELLKLLGAIEAELWDLDRPVLSKSEPGTDKTLHSWVASVAKSVSSTDESPDPPEPVGSDISFANGSRRMALRVYQRDPYQRKLLDSDWLPRFVEELRGYPELCGKNLLVELRPRYNAAFLDSGAGYVVGSRDDERNQHKNRFLLDVTWELPPDSPMDVTYHYEILFNPESRDYAFQRLSCKSLYLWRPGFQDQADLERRLIDSGIVREVTVDPHSPDKALADHSCRGTDECPPLVPVLQRKHVLSVAIDNVATFPTDLKMWMADIVEPVLVRDRERLEAFRDRLYEGLVVTRAAHFRGFKLPSVSPLEEASEAPFTRALDLMKDMEHYHLEYRHHRLGLLRIWVSSGRIAVESVLHFMNSDWPQIRGSFQGKTPPGTWSTLQALAEDEAIWQGDRRRTTGETWTLNRRGPKARTVKLWSTRGGPLIEFCFELMRLAGLEPHVERFVRWREPGKVW